MNRPHIAAASLTLSAVLAAAGQPCDWQPLGTGVAPAADACAVLPNGDIIAGGRFTLAGTVATDFVARWDGQSWNEMGGGLNNFVRTLLALPDGSVVAGGHFTFPNLGPAGLIARWDGSTWQRLGLGLDAGSCRALLLKSGGEIIAGGSFLQADEQPAWCVARWNGDNWSKLGDTTVGGGVTGFFGPEPRPTMVLDILEMPNGDIVVAGDFKRADGIDAPGIARWDGSAWHDVGGGTSGVVRALELLPNGDLLAAGLFGAAGGVPARGLARWDGSRWHAVGEGLNGLNQSSPFDLLRMPDGKILIAGAFDAVDGVPVNNIAIYDPVADQWAALGTGMFPAIQTSVLSLAADGAGRVVASGQFASAGGNTAARNIAVYDCLIGICPADLAEPFGVLDLADVQAFIAAFTAQQPLADLNGDGVWDLADVQGFVASFLAGCP